MKKISWFGVLAVLVPMASGAAGYSDAAFQREVKTGLDLVGARSNVDVLPDVAPGELGADVYQTVGATDNADTQMFIPTTMYVRMGAGLNLGFATDQAKIGSEKFDASGGYATQIGLGWNLSSYVRTEVDFQSTTLKFSDVKNITADYRTVGAMLYFDFARRYVQTGDITRRRTFVPFMGLGAGFGQYEFQGRDGADGFVIAAPRAALGFNVMLTDLIGIDVMYQYNMMIGHGFGWGVRDGGVDNISNVMASFRVNF